jgi:hypothetical protein
VGQFGSNNLIRIWKEAVAAEVEELSQHVPERTEKKYEESQSRQPLSS